MVDAHREAVEGDGPVRGARLIPFIAIAALGLVLLVWAPGTTAEEDGYPVPVTMTAEDCEWAPWPGVSSDRWRCPVEGDGYARLDFEVPEFGEGDAFAGLSYSVVEEDGPHPWGITGWYDEERDGDLVFDGTFWRDRGESDYQSTFLDLTLGGHPLFHHEEEQAATRSEAALTGLSVGQSDRFGPGEHSYYLVYAAHETTNLQQAAVSLFGFDQDETAWELTVFPERAWFFEDRDFEPVAASRSDAGARHSALVDASLTHAFEGTLSGHWDLGGPASAILSFEGPQSCPHYPSPAGATGVPIMHQPPGEYTFGVHASASPDPNPEARLLLADMDVPVPEHPVWPPKTLADEDLNDLAYGTVCQSDEAGGASR